MSQSSDPLLDAPSPVVIESSRLKLRTVQMSDLDAIMPIISSQDAMQWTSQPAVTNLTQGERWLSDRALGRDVFNFVVQLKQPLQQEQRSSSGDGVVGMIGSFHWPEVGYILHPDFYGRGYATEALRVFIPAYFARVPLAGAEEGCGYDHIEGLTISDNVASMRVLEKCGFELCETLQDSWERPGIGLRDMCIYRLARPEKNLEQMGLKATRDGARTFDSGRPATPPVQ